MEGLGKGVFLDSSNLCRGKRMCRVVMKINILIRERFRQICRNKMLQYLRDCNLRTNSYHVMVLWLTSFRAQFAKIVFPHNYPWIPLTMLETVLVFFFFGGKTVFGFKVLQPRQLSSQLFFIISIYTHI